jgi:hypothetical protein
MSSTSADRQEPEKEPQFDYAAALAPFPGVFLDEGTGTGTYFGRYGTERRCDYLEASALARQEGIILTYLVTSAHREFRLSRHYCKDESST